ncbi:hypothetical protein AC579_4839 [Pseudocercospora musae]|uniref:Capsule polysaccharide biosynthesis protein n=1 Tax=Pseudocercospora musae TaxID=113226 RepID=A0A139IKX2_9PEZI|nr:hypothetical protein AC579_4839 [Pseudocercospora musae]
MKSHYTIPTGLHAIPHHLLDLRPDAAIDLDLLNPKPVAGPKNIWFFWHAGFQDMHSYTQRNIRAWHRRFSKHGWVVRVINRVPHSPLNVANFLNLHDPNTFPKAFIHATIGGDYAPQHTSDLVRWPLLLKYGGVYADVGLMQIGDLDRLWSQTVGNSSSPWEVLSYNMGSSKEYALTNYFLCSKPNNPLFARCQKLLLELWAADGGKDSTDGMHASPLVKGAPLMNVGRSFTENGKRYNEQEVSEMLTDYIIQGQVMSSVMGLVDEEDQWNGPEYTKKHIYAVDFMEGSQLINLYTNWDGTEAFRLMSLHLPKDGEAQDEDQKTARDIVEGCLSRSFGFKLAHGIILRVIGPTLGSLWRGNAGSDFVPGTYAHWLRHGMIYWNQEAFPKNQEFEVIEPFKRGPLLREA